WAAYPVFFSSTHPQHLHPVVSAMTVIQEPPFASFSQGKELTFNCSHSESGSYHFFWYQLQHLGTLQYFTDTWTEEFSHEPKNWLEAKWLGVGKKEMILHLENLQAGDTGLYLCAARDTVREARTGAGTKQSPRKEGTTSADNSASIINTQSHSVEPKSITLVCLAHGFSYAWPLDVIWKRDGQAVPRFSAATEEPKAEGKCSFGIASRLSIATSEWKEGHTYSCHVRQADIADVKDEMTSESRQKSSK
uniref:Ig-like domain-containing protein n=1 Tax=Anolis carolinensis TaxID=28377 RepID=A0A803TK97_ANOCA